MTIDEVTKPDPLNSELKRNEKAQQALRVRKAQVKAQQAQQHLRDVRSAIT